MITNTLTCVYTINDHAAFSDERDRINSNFKQSAGEPWAITAMSCGHEMRRLDLIENAHEKSRHDLLDEIFGMIDPTLVEDITELEGY